MKKNFLVIGNGGREHSICKKLLQSDYINKIFAIPGCNLWEGINSNTKISVMEFNNIKNFIKLNNIEYIIVGPEEPIVNGITDYLKKHGINKIFAPSQYCAMLEKDKAWSKDIMNNLKISTAKHFHAKNINDFNYFIDNNKMKTYVLKSVKLAAGKGVFITKSPDEAKKYAEDIFINNIYGENNSLIIEEFLEGNEFSLICATDGSNIFPFVPTCDHKKIYDGDKGPNTGGMGIYNNPNFINKKELIKCIENTIKPVIDYFRQKGNKYIGVLFAGIMKTNKGEFKVIEYNVRFGDPETEILLHLLKSDFGKFIIDILDKKIPNDLKFSDNNAIGVVVSAKGYPKKYPKNIDLGCLKNIDNSFEVIYMGATNSNNKIISTGGRIAIIIKSGNSPFKKLHKELYNEIIDKINYNDLYFRTDIGRKNF